MYGCFVPWCVFCDIEASFHFILLEVSRNITGLHIICFLSCRVISEDGGLRTEGIVPL
jgi:hypothetical protein